MDKSIRNHNKKSNILEKRLTILKKGYQNPSIVSFSFDLNTSGECSDMKSPCTCHVCSPGGF